MNLYLDHDLSLENPSWAVIKKKHAGIPSSYSCCQCRSSCLSESSLTAIAYVPDTHGVFTQCGRDQNLRMDHLSAVGATQESACDLQVSLRTAIGGGQGTDCFHHLHHETLRVVGEGSQTGVDIIVDSAFKDQFTISQSTPTYGRLMEALPQEFVGPSSRLAPLVQLMCQVHYMLHRIRAGGHAAHLLLTGPPPTLCQKAPDLKPAGSLKVACNRTRPIHDLQVLNCMCIPWTARHSCIPAAAGLPSLAVIAQARVLQGDGSASTGTEFGDTLCGCAACMASCMHNVARQMARLPEEVISTTKRPCLSLQSEVAEALTCCR